MIARPFGERALFLRLGRHPSPALTARLAALAEELASASIPGLVEVVPGHTTLLLHFRPEETDHETLARRVREVAVSREGGRPGPGPVRGPTCHLLPVVYGGEGGPDLEKVAGESGLRPEEVVRQHSSPLYSVSCFGFAPGFAYLGELPPPLRLPRRGQARDRVPRGAVGIAGPHTGVYPGGTPGGWHLIGWTPAEVYSPGEEERALFRVGDEVRFVPVPEWKGGEVKSDHRQGGAAGESPAGEGVPFLRILHPGVLASFQDGGREGYRAEGVAPLGPADVFSFHALCRLLGNSPRDAAVEVLLFGFSAEVLSPGLIAVTGADLGATLNGRELPLWQVVEVKPGDRITFSSPRRGMRAYLGVAGGFSAPRVLGSASYDPLLGMIPLRPGEVLLKKEAPLSPPPRPGQRWPPELEPAIYREITVRVTLGPEAGSFPREALGLLFSSSFRVSPRSDRRGLRLEGPRLPGPKGDRPSEGVVSGTLQVTPSGEALLLLEGSQTTGGYPVLAVAIEPDLCLLAQARPGEAEVRFRYVSLEEARASSLEFRSRLRFATLEPVPSPPATSR